MSKDKNSKQKVASTTSKSSGRSPVKGSSLQRTGTSKAASKSLTRSTSKVVGTGRISNAKSVAGSVRSESVSKFKRSNFLKTARSLNLEGPKDWSSRFDDHHNGRKD